MHRWIEEHNKDTTVLGIRWLLQEPRRVGKAASSLVLVVYMKEAIKTNKGVRMGRKILRTEYTVWLGEIGEGRGLNFLHSSLLFSLGSRFLLPGL